MSATIIDGEAVAAQIKEGLKKDIEALAQKGRTPHLHAVQATDNPGSKVYVKSQQKSCEEMGIKYTLDELPIDAAEAQLIEHVRKLNADPAVTGIILQMPVPPGVNGRKVQAEIAPPKDVEGLNPQNMGMVVFGNPRLGPCTAMGAFELLKSIPMEPSKPIPDFMEKMIKDLGVKRGFYGKEVCVVGHSEIVGKPLSLLLLHSFCTVTTCHIGTVNLKEHTRKADILCVAVGKAGLITKDLVQPGAIVIDIGINRVRAVGPDGKPITDPVTGKTKMRTVGDVDFDNAKDVAGMITPVPGGVGPMTVAILLRNTVEAAKAMA